ncbi:MAG: four helix bundle protein [Phycisphaerae bacterium]
MPAILSFCASAQADSYRMEGHLSRRRHRTSGLGPRALDFRFPTSELRPRARLRHKQRATDLWRTVGVQSGHAHHTKLRAFQLADGLALAVYAATAVFPKHELFGLAQQLRRAAVSCASNIVEGCARNSQTDYLRFLDMAYGSACETEYQLSLAQRLGYLNPSRSDTLCASCRQTAKVLNALIRSLRNAAPGS